MTETIEQVCEIELPTNFLYGISKCFINFMNMSFIFKNENMLCISAMDIKKVILTEISIPLFKHDNCHSIYPDKIFNENLSDTTFSIDTSKLYHVMNEIKSSDSIILQFIHVVGSTYNIKKILFKSTTGLLHYEFELKCINGNRKLNVIDNIINQYNLVKFILNEDYIKQIANYLKSVNYIRAKFEYSSLPESVYDNNVNHHLKIKKIFDEDYNDVKSDIIIPVGLKSDENIKNLKSVYNQEYLNIVANIMKYLNFDKYLLYLNSDVPVIFDFEKSREYYVKCVIAPIVQ